MFLKIIEYMNLFFIKIKNDISIYMHGHLLNILVNLVMKNCDSHSAV